MRVSTSTFLVSMSLASMLALGGCAMEVDDSDVDVTEQALHAWGSYHWARTTPSFDLITVNSLTPDWDGYLSLAIASWNTSAVLNFAEDVNGDTSSKTRRRCQGDPGQIRVCNLAYGPNGWLGLAGISVDANNHITTGYTKINDTYFGTATYDDPTWKQGVVCQEIGHDVGLGHQDEDFNSEVPLFSCMDYQDPIHPEPNTHDYDQLEAIYEHLDSYDSYDNGSGGGGDGGGDGGCSAPPGKGCNKVGLPGWWGESVARNGNVERFVRPNPDGSMEVTTVTWADGHDDSH